jgi:MoaA/NifB/PqqE/SkfB family radical SAM enzyme
MLRHPEVRYEVTDLCNAKCVMCPRDKHDREHGIMDMEKFKKSIDEVVSLGCKRVTLTGFGEPFIDRRLEEKILYAKGKGLHTYVITNGSLLRSRAESIADTCLDELRISFYGMSPRTYNKIMQGLDFEKSKEGILLFLRLRRTTKVQISYLIFDDNEDYHEFLEFWEPLVDYVEVWKPHNFGDGRDYRRREGVKRTCGRPENGPLQIQWDGTVIPCCYDYNNAIVLGNAFESSVMDVLEGPKYNALREAHRKGEFEKFEYCNQCDQLLERSDVLVYTNRHSLPNEVAVQLSNTDLSNLQKRTA